MTTASTSPLTPRPGRAAASLAATTSPVTGASSLAAEASDAATAAIAAEADVRAPGAGRLRGVRDHVVRWLRGETRPEAAATPRTRWERPALLVLLAVTTVAYLWNLAASGWGNSFYAAAAQAGSQNWEAFLYGSSDMGNSISVDKPPAFLWVMALSVRLFGLNSWALLVPEALMGVLSVAVLHGAVRRVSTPQAALIAGFALAATPIAALMFRYDNPDALLVLLLTVTAWLVLRAVQDGRTRWMALAGLTVGFAFLTKQLQAFVVLPGFAVAYLIAAPVSLRRRIRDGFIAVGTLVAGAGWWVALVELVPSDWRPYVGGSQDDSFLELTFGYNGFGRITGDETGSVGGMEGQGGMWGETGITRLFEGEFGGQASWLIPAALVLLVALLVVTWRRPRTDALRASAVIWGSWLVVTGLVFSFMSGIFHAYYTVALAPGIAGLVGLGCGELWRRRDRWPAVVTLGAVTALTVVWAWVLLGRSSSVEQWPVLVVGVLAGLALALSPWLPWTSPWITRAAAAAALAAAFTGPVAYTLYTVQRGYTGSIITAGPSVSTTSMGGVGGPGSMGGGLGDPGAMTDGGSAGVEGSGSGTTGAMPTADASEGGPASGDGSAGRTMSGGQGGQGRFGGPGGQDGDGGHGQTEQDGPDGAGQQTSGTPELGGMGGMSSMSGMSGLLDGGDASDEIVALLEDTGDARWAAATTGSQSAAAYQLASNRAVMPIGGFNGTDPAPTLEEFQQHVGQGEIRWYIAGRSMGRSMGGSDAAEQISEWVEQHFTAQTVDGVTLYDLTPSTE